MTIEERAEWAMRDMMWVGKVEMVEPAPSGVQRGIIVAALYAAVAEERDRCAKVVKRWHSLLVRRGEINCLPLLKEITDAIRAGGNPPASPPRG